MKEGEGGQAAAEAAATAPEGVEALNPIRGGGGSEPLELRPDILWGVVWGIDNNRGDGGSADGGGRAIADQRDNLTRFTMHGKLTESRAELTGEKAASNKGRGRGSGLGHPPKKVGLAKSRLLGRLAGREVVGEYKDIMGDLAYHKRKGESAKINKGLTFT